MEKRQTVLIVEDNETTSKFIGACLPKFKFEVQQCNSTSVAFNFLESFDPFLIIIDIIFMNDVNGYDFIRRVNQFYPNKKFVVVSSLEAAVNDFILMEKGLKVSGILQKPFTEDDLLKAVISAIET